MAEGNNDEELRQRVIANLATSRVEIGVEMRRLRIAPKVAFHRVVDHHKGALGLFAIAAALGAWAIFRRRPAPRYANQPAPRPSLPSRLLRKLAAPLIPALLKYAVLPLLLGSSNRSKDRAPRRWPAT